MYTAIKDGMKCRIPESKVPYYKKMGYTVKKLKDADTPKAESAKKTTKADNSVKAEKS